MVRPLLRTAVLCLALCAACASARAPSEPAPPSSTTRERMQKLLGGLFNAPEVTLEGRSFSLFVLPPSSAEELRGVAALQIDGDDRSISFCTTGAPPGEVTVVGSEIRFGGHTFTVTRIPGEYLVDGLVVTLRGTTRERVFHCVSDGCYWAARQF